MLDNIIKVFLTIVLCIWCIAVPSLYISSIIHAHSLLKSKWVCTKSILEGKEHEKHSVCLQYSKKPIND